MRVRKQDPVVVAVKELRTFSPAAATATAILTPKMAFAPSFPLLGVPSSLIRKSSISFCWVTVMPDWMSSGAMMSFTFLTAFMTPIIRVDEDDKHESLQGGHFHLHSIVRTFADVLALDLVTELDGFMDTSGRARGDGCPEYT